MKVQKWKPTAKELGQMKRWNPTQVTMQIRKLRAFKVKE